MRRSMSLAAACLIALVTVVGAAPHAAAATSADGFGVPSTLEYGQDGSDYGVTAVAVGPTGNAIAAWTYYDPVLLVWNVWSSIYVPGQGWSDKKIHIGYNYETFDPAVAAMGDGSLLLALRDPGDGGATKPYIWAQVWTPNSGWSAGTTISSGLSSDVAWLHARADGMGNAFVAWMDSNGTFSNVTANRYSQDFGWGGPVTLDNVNAQAYDMSLSVGRGGDALVTWRQTAAADPNIYAARYVFGSGWNGPEVVDASTQVIGGAATFGAVSTDGVPVVMWSQYDGSFFRVWGSFYALGSWSSPARLNAGAVTLAVSLLQLEATSDGAVVAIWADAGAGWNAVNMSRLAGASWGAPVRFYPMDTSSVPPTFVASDGAGGLAAALGVYNGATSQEAVQVAPWNPSDGLWPTRAMGSYIPAYEVPLAVGEDGGGRGAFIYAEYTGSHNSIRVFLYQKPDTTPPVINAFVVGGPVTVNSSAVVEGGGYLDAGITVNGVQAAYGEFGFWDARVPLHPGNNTLTVIAKDAAGNTAYAWLYVDYNDPVPGLQANLSATQAQLAAAQAALVTSQQNFHAATLDIGTLEDGQAALRTNLTAAQADNAAQAAKITEFQAAGGGGSGTLFGILGIVIGLAAIAMSFMMSRKGAGTSAPPKEETKSAEPPKTG